METVIMHAYDIMYYNERADLLVETFYGKDAVDAIVKQYNYYVEPTCEEGFDNVIIL